MLNVNTYYVVATITSIGGESEKQHSFRLYIPNDRAIQKIVYEALESRVSEDGRETRFCLKELPEYDFTYEREIFLRGEQRAVFSLHENNRVRFCRGCEFLGQALTIFLGC